MDEMRKPILKYCESIHKTMRWKTREVMVGNVGVGGDNPVRIQSMTTSSTRDVEATIEQIVRLADTGCEIARVTVQGIKEADACEHIKNGLLRRGYNIPLVADIHFFPPAAMKVTDFVDKVRINPGNFVDKRATFKTLEYDDDSYAQELIKIEEKFAPLVEKCKRLKRSMRIGTNHGSLSDRIMNRYGDSPRGMVESAVEFANVCRKYDYHDFIFSMKASNPQVMILAYRLLVAEMIKLGWDYPLHLGVTEAGLGEDGRIKSAIGIGSLLLDGIGDTIRVSLTEDAWEEIDPCKRLIHFAEGYQGQGVAPFSETHRTIEEIKKRQVILSKEIALHRDGSVLVQADGAEFERENFYQMLGCEMQFGRPKLKATSVEGVVFKSSSHPIPPHKVRNLNEAGITVYATGTAGNGNEGIVQIYSLEQDHRTLENQLTSDPSRFHPFKMKSSPLVLRITEGSERYWDLITSLQPSLLFLSPMKNRLHYCRQFFEWLQQHQIKTPVILNFSYHCSKEDLIIQAATECGALFCDGLGDGILLEAPHEIDFMRSLSFNILQASRLRIFKTDFISCPSCGRTLFDLQEVTKNIRSRTAHLAGVKIAIMGCIVNGPGEMADADFGYVGSKPGMIDLYVGKQCVEKDIPFAEAVDHLVDLLKRYGRWVEPELAEVSE